MKKKFIAAVSAAVLMLVSSVSVLADDAVITFHGEAGDFVTQENGASEGFKGMEPGETREVTLKLVNEDAEEMKFYLSGTIAENIAAKGDGISVYDIDISQGEEEPFFSGIIGSEDSVGEQYLGENFLLAALKKGESTEVTLGVTLDGSSTGNEYQNTEGKLRFSIGVEKTAQGTRIEKEYRKNYIQGGSTYNKTTKTLDKSQGTTSKAKNAKTGDENSILFMAAAFAAAGAAAVILIVTKRKKRTEESR